MKNWARISVTVLAVLAILLTASELYLRKVGYSLAYTYLPSEELPDAAYLRSKCGWFSTPGDHASFEDKSITEGVWTNGQRISRRQEKKPAEYRVLEVGCSYTYGVGVNNNQTFVWKLNEAFPQVVFDNYGVCGYGTYQNYLEIAYLLDKYPYDLVIYNNIGSHLFRNTTPYINGQVGQDKRFCLTPYVEVDSRGQLVMHPADSMGWWGEKQLVTVLFLKRACYGFMLGSHTFDVEPPKRDKVFLDLIKMMDQAAKSKNSKFAVFALDQEGAEFLTPNLDKSIRYYDVSFPEVDSADYRINKDLKCHPDARIHSTWAARMLAPLEEIINS